MGLGLGLQFQKGGLQGLPFLQISSICSDGNILMLSDQPTEGNMPMWTQALIPQTLLWASLKGISAHEQFSRGITQAMIFLFYFFVRSHPMLKYFVVIWSTTLFLLYT